MANRFCGLNQYIAFTLPLYGIPQTWFTEIHFFSTVATACFLRHSRVHGKAISEQERSGAGTWAGCIVKGDSRDAVGPRTRNSKEIHRFRLRLTGS
jgi:hypothetical protein